MTEIRKHIGVMILQYSYMESITEKVFSRIYGHGRGWVFSQIDFFDLGSKNAIDTIVSRSTKKGTIG